MSLKRWERRGKQALTRALTRAVGRAPARDAPPDLASVRRILLVRQHNQLGDMILGSPLLRAIRARAPEARIDFVSGPVNHEAVRCSRRVDEVLRYDKERLLRSPLEAKRFAERLKDAKYDLALVLNTVAFSHTAAWLAVVSGAARRAGRAGPGGKGADVAQDLFDWVLPPPVEHRHQTGVHLDLGTPFGAPDDDWRPEIDLDPADAGAGRAALAAAVGLPGPGLRILMHPGAGKVPNRWPAERFGEVARALRAVGHRVALCAGPAERPLLSAVDGGAGVALPHLPSLSVHALGAAFATADLAIVNDTGVLHLAAAAGAHVLALFGPTDPAVWCPASPRVWTMRAPGGVLAALETRAVAQAAVAVAAHVAGEGRLPRTVAPAPTRTPAAADAS